MVENEEKQLAVHFLQGKRIYLRGLSVSDVGDSYCCWMNDPAVNQYLESRFIPQSQSCLKTYVESFEGDRNNVILAIILKRNEQHIGNIKLGPIDWYHRLGDVGILIGAKEQWGKEYATEAISLLAGYAFRTLNLHKLKAASYDTNKGSIRAFEKAGFSVEGVRKEQYFCNGRYVDSILLGFINPLERENAAKT